ncbi:MAG: NmrA family NAD(P)-binding protein [Gemmatimonadota bacterium]|nr:NmrA family NAD(P)-binding protein [Gemmatimonadota bacterium]
MEVLCLGGTGAVGSLVVRGLLDRGASVRCMTRSEVGGREAGGVRYIRGDLEDPSSLGPAFEGVDRLHLLTPLHPDETGLGRAAVDAAVAAGVGRIVFHSIHNVEAAPHVPHFASKIAIFDEILSSGIPWVTIEPNHYFQNDLMLREPIMEMQLYPAPIGEVGLTRVDVRDIADATVNALLDDGHEGNRYPIVGPETLTGEDVAGTWGDALDGTIVYVGDDLDMWEDSVRDMLPGWMIDDLRAMSQHFLDHGLVASEEDYATMSHVLGHAPRLFRDFVDETIAAWR